MKKSLLLVFLAATAIFSLVGKGVSESKSADNELNVYCYDSFVGDWGPAAAIKEGFEAKTGIKLNLISCGGAAEMLQKLRYEGDKTEADMVIGIEDSLNVDHSIFEQISLPSSVTLAPALSIENGVLVPFDYGVYAFVADTDRISDLPASLDDLTKPQYKDRVILMDPRTSSVGMGLLLWTISAYGEDGYLDWWEKMKDNALTIADSWSSGYGLFTEGEAPLVISFSTSPVYHVMYEDTTAIKALEFSEGHHGCIEYAGILKTASHEDNARLFLEYLLTEAQSEIAVDNSMFPANAGVSLPAAFDYAMRPQKVFYTDRETLVANQGKYIEAWSEIMVK